MTTDFWVFDTNTLLSALLNENSPPGQALKKARSNSTLLVSAEIAHEYFEVFSRSKFDRYISLETRLGFIENIITNALPIQVNEHIAVCRDPKDDKYLSLAVAANASAIITGDADLLVLHPFRGIPILNAVGFLTFFSN